MSDKTFLIVDTYYFLHRAFHAFPTTLKTATGETTNMVFGFCQMVLDLMAKFDPEFIAFSGETLEQPSFRKTLYNSYQLNRMFGDPDEDMIFAMQIPRINEFLECIGCKVVFSNGFEGDDIIGTISKKSPKDVNVIIATADQDIMQLVDNNISVYRPARPPYVKEVIYNIDAIKEKYGFEPIDMIDYKALRGDPSDNIPGVKGIGEKTAKDLLIQFKNLDNIYKNLDNIKSEKVRQLLIQDKDKAYLSHQLATIITDVPIQFKIDDFEIKSLDLTNTEEFFKKLEFNSLIKKLDKIKIILKDKIKQDTKSQLNLI